MNNPITKSMLLDTFKRRHNYLRISLTERCNFRCTYCMPEEGVPLTPTSQILTNAEIIRISRVFVSLLGVSKIRLTGGEPTIRKDLVSLTRELNGLKPNGLESIAMTTNGLVLGRMLPDLLSAGMDSLNISLDTLDPLKFPLMTRRNGHEKVLKAIDYALDLGFPSVKLNCVIMKNINHLECFDFVEYTRDRNISVRFIEYMPFDGNKWDYSKMVPYKELLELIRTKYDNIEKISDSPHDTCKHYQVSGYRGSVGFISSMSNHFCGTCNRLRITADGNLKVCLFGNAEVSLRDAIRSGMNDDELCTVISNTVLKKKFSHDGMFEIAQSKNRPMVLIGG